MKKIDEVKKISEYYVPVVVPQYEKVNLMLKLALANFSCTFTEYGTGTIITILR